MSVISITRRNPGGSPIWFSVVVTDGSLQWTVAVSARRLFRFGTFRADCFAEIGRVFTNPRYDGRAGGAYWRSDLDALLNPSGKGGAA